MLDNLRNFGRTWPGKILGAFLIVGLAGFGISNVLLNFGSETVASVGDVEVSVRDFQRAYNADLNRVGQQLGRVPTTEEATGMGIPSSTLNRLVSEAAMEQVARNMGLGVSDVRLGRLVREDPSFAGIVGGFDRQSFTFALQQLGYTEKEYFELQSRAARRQQLAAGLFADTSVPNAAQELLERYSTDSRSVDYFVVSADQLPSVPEPTEEELAAYLAGNQEQFRTEETRTVDLLVLSPTTLAAAQEVTEEEIVAEFERTRDTRSSPERRAIRQAPLTAEQAEAFEQGLAAGRSFEELVAETGATVTDLGTVTRSDLVDSALASAAFGLEEGTFTIIPGIGGRRAVHVSTIEAAGEVSLDDVREDVRQQVATAKVRAVYNEVLDQVEELRAAGRPIPEIAERFDLEPSQVTLTASGAALSEVEGLPANVRERVTTAIFSAELGRLAPTIPLPASNNVRFELTAVEPARDQTLDEVREQVAATIVAERRETAMNETIEAILKRLRAGEPFFDVAMSVGQYPILSQPFTRTGDGTPIISAQVAAAAFSGGPGHFGAAVNGDGQRVVFQVVDIVPAEVTDDEQAADYLDQTTRESLYNEFVTALRDEMDVRVNQQALGQVLGLEQ